MDSHGRAKAGRTLPIAALTAIFAGCAGSPTQGPTLTLPAAVSHGNSWMLPLKRVSGSILIYAEDAQTGHTNVYDYANGTQVGQLSDFVSIGGCVDARGDVYLVDSGNGTLVEYAHGGTTPLRTYSPGGELVGCSIDSKGDLAITGAAPGRLIVYAKGNPNKSVTHSDSYCEFDVEPMGYDNHNNVIGEGEYADISVCGLLAGTKQETTLTTSGITINAANGAMWDGKYLVVGDQEAGSGKDETGMYQTTLSGTTLSSAGEVMLTDTCYRGYTAVANPFVLGKKNTPVNTEQGKVVVGSNFYCFQSSGGGGIEFWHYPKGGNPYKIYKSSDEITILAVSIGT